MKLEEMESDPRNKRRGICDPCQQFLNGPKPRIRLALPPAPSEQHQRLKHVLELADLRKRRVFSPGAGHISDNCWKDGHKPEKCNFFGCDCACHKGENAEQAKARAKAADLGTPPVVAATDSNGRVGAKILVEDEETGERRWMFWSPSGELMDLHE